MQYQFTALGELPPTDPPNVSLPALLDLLDALDLELGDSPGLIRLWSEELRKELAVHLDAPP